MVNFSPRFNCLAFITTFAILHKIISNKGKQFAYIWRFNIISPTGFQSTEIKINLAKSFRSRSACLRESLGQVHVKWQHYAVVLTCKLSEGFNNTIYFYRICMGLKRLISPKQAYTFLCAVNCNLLTRICISIRNCGSQVVHPNFFFILDRELQVYIPQLGGVFIPR